MRNGFLVGMGAALALAAFSSTDAAACGGRRGCGSYYAPPAAYSYAPVVPPAYGYLPPGPAYGYAPPASYGGAVGYGYAPAGYGFYGDAGYGYRGSHGCDRGYGYGYGYGDGYGYAPPVAYDSYRPAAVWVPVR